MIYYNKATCFETYWDIIKLFMIYYNKATVLVLKLTGTLLSYIDKNMARGFDTHIFIIFKEEYREHGKERMNFHII
jgi:hypothetical protein